MTTLVWDNVEDRVFETGVSHGVFYPDTGPGVPWNGLTSVEHTRENGDVTPLYFEGVKRYDLMDEPDSSATLKAFTYPDEFLGYDGMAALAEGVRLDSQPQKRFGLSYKTLIADGTTGVDVGYKIHLLYNILAIPDTIMYGTLTDKSTAPELTWALHLVPQTISGFRATAHLTIDSRTFDPDILALVDGVLYGTDTLEPSLPSIEELRTMIVEYSPIHIVDNGDGSWSATGPSNLIVKPDPDTFQITGAHVTWLDAVTYQISGS